MRRIVCVGGGPAGLFTAILARLAFPSVEVTVHERNHYDATYGFGVVFSDETLDNIAAADPVAFARIEAEFRHWSDLEIRKADVVTRTTGHGFAAFPRLRLLQILADRAVELGADVRFGFPVGELQALDADLVVVADGVNSRWRSELGQQFDPQVTMGSARYAWFGTEHDFGVFTFLFEETAEGIVQAHCYPYSNGLSTFIVEMSADTWERAELDTGDGFEPGETDPRAVAFAEKTFGHHLDGHSLIGNASRWIRFPEVTTGTWWHDRYVLMGDAAHTAHFSIGSGTKLAMEDAIALVEAVADRPGDVPSALASYEALRKPQVESTQRAARTSQDWFESVERYWNLPRPQFDFQLLTRSQRITLDNLRLRDPEGTEAIVEGWRARQELPAPQPSTPPMFHPFRLRDVTFPNRVGVSPMAQYSAVDGVATDWHLVHLGSRAVGGAGLVMVEMTCVSPDGRITPGCTGLWNDPQEEAFRPIVDFIHSHTDAVAGMQLGHSGRKGGMLVPWEADDDVTPVSWDWERLAPSRIPYLDDGPVPTAMTRRHMDEVRDQFVSATHRTVRLGFDLLELHMAHGYLLSTFISPLTNLRDDGYGGRLESRMRFPLEIVDAVRAAWPGRLPLSVRISAEDWAEGGTTGEEAVAIARMFGDHGVDIVDVSTGQVVPDQRPRYGRLWQTPFADRIRHEADIPTMTVGAVASIDDVNTVLVAGRADICLLARPHLVDPYWTLNAAIDQGHGDHPWPVQYEPGRTARRRDQDANQRL